MICVALAVALCIAPSAPSEAPTATPVAARSGSAPSADANASAGPRFNLDPSTWVGDEDLLLVFQTIAALGSASLIGGLALLPAYGLFFVVALISLASQSPGLLVAGPAAMLALTLVTQALVAGITVWLVSRASESFAARTYVPAWARDVIKDNTGTDIGRGWWGFLLGAPWLTGFAGYLVGGALGLVLGAAVAVPMLGAGFVLAQQPQWNAPGLLAVFVAAAVGFSAMAFGYSLLGPVGAALAHHATKVAVEDSVR
ncbi:MAG: hypothetical protein AB2A00_28190 [Myxococcota bacterium]